MKRKDALNSVAIPEHEPIWCTETAQSSLNDRTLVLTGVQS